MFPGPQRAVKEDRMPTNLPPPDTLEDAVAKIASILAQGCLPHQKKRGVSLDSEYKIEKVMLFQLVTENQRDGSGHRSLHS